MVPTALSASPLACGYFGLHVMCLNSHAVAKARNVSAEYCGPLSVTTCSGIPCLANMDFMWFTVEGEAVLLNLAISTNVDR